MHPQYGSSVKSRLTVSILITIFCALENLSYTQISVSEYMELNDPSISFDTVAKSTINIKKEKGKLGLVNALGDWIAPPVYDKIGNIEVEADNEGYSLQWKNGIAIVKKNGKYGIINCQGKEIIPCKYINISRSDDGSYSLKDLKGKSFVADKRGQLVTGKNHIYTFGFRRVDLIKTNFGDYSPKSNYAYINKKGDTIFKLTNSSYIFSVLGHSEGMTAFLLYPCIHGGLGHSSGTIGFLDSTGKIAVPPIYSAKYINSVRGMSSWMYKPAFHSGLALVFKGDTAVYIDKTGKEVLNFKNKPGNVSVLNNFNDFGFTMITYYVTENEKSTHYVEIIDTTGKAVIQSTGHIGEDGLVFSDISNLNFFYLNDAKGKTLYNAKLEKQYSIPRSDENYNYSFFPFPDKILTCIVRKNKITHINEYTFIDRTGQQICDYLPTDVYYEPITGTTIKQEDGKVLMSNKSNEVVYSCDSCSFGDLLTIEKNYRYTSSTSGIFRFWHKNELLVVNYKGMVIDRFQNADSAIGYFRNLSDEYKNYSNMHDDPDIKIAVTQAELDKIYQEMPWKNKW